MRSFDLWLRNVTLWEAPPLACLALAASDSYYGEGLAY